MRPGRKQSRAIACSALCSRDVSHRFDAWNEALRSSPSRTKKSRATLRRSALRYRATPASARGLCHVLRGRALLTLHEVEFHGLPFSETLEAIAMDRAVVHEAILVSGVGRDEPKPLRVVEQIHFSGRTHTCSSMCGRSLRRCPSPGDLPYPRPHHAAVVSEY